MDKKTIKMFSYIIGAFVGFILILFIISSCTKKKSGSADAFVCFAEVSKNIKFLLHIYALYDILYA